MQLDQANSDYEVQVPHLGKDAFVFLSLAGSEYVSHTYEFKIRMATKDKGMQGDSLLRKPMVMKLRRQGQQIRLIHGLIQRARVVGVTEENPPTYYWEVMMVPWLWFLTLEVDCRHFINMTAVEIIKKVFDGHGYTDYQFKTQGSFPKREFTVQYRESSFNFISRLLEEEGIFYWFEHTEGKHQLILANANTTTQPCPVNPKLPFGKGTFSGAAGSGGVIDVLEHETAVHTGKLTLQDYNFEKSSVSLLSTSKGEQKAEIYDYPGNYTTKADGERYVLLRLEEQEARLRTIESHSEVPSLIPGYRLEIEDHFEEQANTNYLILSSGFACRQGGVGDEYMASASSSSSYFTAIPMNVPYRPPRRHAKPMIHGIQTAVVCGPAGNEIHCDKFGRVKVQFHWDRLNKKNDDSSYWIRVSSAWAGAEWGQISIPRIGQEVIISFLEGDPDRPMVTGRVFNDQQMPPYSLPDNKTQSGTKSRSSTGGGSSNFNEFRFEDKKGSEQIYLHAEKDFDELIENKHTVTIQKSDEIIVLEQGNREITLKKGNTTHTHTLGNHSLECTAGKISEKAAQEIKMEVTPSKITMTPAMIKLEIGGTSITMTAGAMIMKAPVILQN